MPGFTPNFNIEYPCAGEVISPAVFQAFADDVEAALSTVEALNVAALNRPRARMSDSLTGASVASGVLTTWTYPTVDYAAGITTAPTTITVTDPGVYMVDVNFFQIGFFAAATNPYWLGQILRNGVIIYRRKIGDTLGTEDKNNSVTGLVICNAADTLTTQFQWSGTPTPQTFGATFSVSKICDL